MTYIWDIYEPADAQCYNAEDPFDIFIFSLRRDEAPRVGSAITVEGRMRRIIAVAIDHNKNEVFGLGGEQYYKVCVNG
jgi:hypothetical protein